MKPQKLKLHRSPSIKKLHRVGTSQYKGVRYSDTRDRTKKRIRHKKKEFFWYASITHEKKRYHLGGFKQKRKPPEPMIWRLYD